MNYNVLSDSDLIALYKEGDDRAFEALLHKYKTKTLTTILLIVKNKQTAEDLLQETFIKVIHFIKLGKYNEEGKFATWLARIAHNLAIDYFRRNKNEQKVFVGQEALKSTKNIDWIQDSIEEHRIKLETFDKLRTLIQQLPDAQREVLILKHYNDMSFQEIAQITQVSVNTALGRMRYALMNLKKRFHQTSLEYDQNLYPK